MHNFTPISAAIGGALIGLSAALLWLGMGRIAGGPMPPVLLPASSALIVIAGLLVGFGTRLGGGCTSGHGVCGIARLSRRSLAATALFMASAVVTVLVTRHIIGI